MASETPLIMTGRLELRPFRAEDAAELYEIFSDPETHTIGEGPFMSLAQTAAWISRRAETERQHGLLWYAARDRASGRITVGSALDGGPNWADGAIARGARLVTREVDSGVVGFRSRLHG